MESAAKADHTARKYYAQEAFILLQRSVSHGDFGLGKVESVLALIQSLLSDKAI
ncbi:hypothetical protein [Nitrospira sp. KM1]|uniref:hypothetical protein n=1 Tax=Nitrospira sp. KM1 TaxID=1936990 RepID=UPI001564E5B4|nr:hypothetical protein [Nitrospira sp. KM1]